ncbi:hypothetical protein CEUSTIGMA_g2480.t1 [Chlamydomonas eustigma]|uniref:RNA-editing substrate-binding complex 6 protein domain-containing protein n=1 Tax=Chlamydomonas eustigma TaxID=1157962 RepID=A0A250WW96_9CHLO|nr:hypothetical protein CEUSTIGMA_g2480.t1 [Chlamydomonas eustigma]|eukprot:GAX75036.1 hypothetical protein CEUSTIGMA_g2480.t1 [Chlamydomonas eustigma]
MKRLHYAHDVRQPRGQVLQETNDSYKLLSQPSSARSHRQYGFQLQSQRSVKGVLHRPSACRSLQRDSLGTSLRDSDISCPDPAGVALQIRANQERTWTSDLHDLNLEYSLTDSGPHVDSNSKADDSEDLSLNQRRTSSEGTSTSHAHSHPFNKKASHIPNRNRKLSAGTMHEHSSSYPARRPTAQDSHQHQAYRVTNISGSTVRSNFRTKESYSPVELKAGSLPTDLSDRALMKFITGASGTAQLHRLWKMYQGTLNHLHIAAMINCLAKAPDALHPQHASPLQDMLQHMEAAFIRYLPRYSSRELSTTLWAWGHLEHMPLTQTWDHIKQALLQPHPHIPPDHGSETVVDRTSSIQSHPSLTPSRMLSAATPQALAIMAWGLSQLRYCDSEILDALAVACRSSRHQLQPRDISNIVWAYAKLGYHHHHLFSDLCHCIISKSLDLTPHDLANIAWAYATVGHPYKPLFKAVGGTALHLLPGFTAQGLSNMLWAFTAARVPDPELYEALAGESLHRLHQFAPKHMAMAAWGLARGGKGQSIMLTAIAEQAETQLQDFKTKELSLLLWSLSWSGHHSSSLFNSAPSVLSQRIAAGRFSWQDLAHAAWAFATSGQYHEQLFASVSEACLSNLPGFVASPSALDTIVGSLGMVGHYHEQLFTAVGKLLHSAEIASEEQWDAQRVGNNHKSMTFYTTQQLDSETSESRSEERSHDGRGRSSGYGLPQLMLKPAQACNMLAALAGAGHVDVEACRAVTAGLRRCLESTPDKVSFVAVANCCWALAVMDFCDPSFMDLAFHHIAQLEHRRKLTLEASGNLNEMQEEFSLKGRHAASPTVLSHQYPASLSATADKQLPWPVEGGEIDSGTFSTNKVRSRAASATDAVVPRIRETMQLLQASVWWSDHNVAKGPATKRVSVQQRKQLELRGLPVELMEAAKSVWQDSASSSVVISDLQREVFAGLKQDLGLMPKMEVKTPDGMFSMDIVVPWRGVQVAVEVNGPQHYTKILNKPSSKTCAHAHSVMETPLLLHSNKGSAAPPSPRLDEFESDTFMLLNPKQPLRPNGYKILRDHFLRNRGYLVVNVSWLEWEHACSGGSLSVKNFLEGLLNNAWNKRHSK